jgi:hypothetical protein
VSVAARKRTNAIRFRERRHWRDPLRLQVRTLHDLNSRTVALYMATPKEEALRFGANLLRAEEARRDGSP